MTFLHSFDPGGVERVALRMVGAWSAMGQEVHVVMGRDTGSEARPEGPTFHFARPNRYARHFESLWMVPHMVAAVRRVRPDVLFCAGNTYVVVMVLGRLLLGRDCPPIVCKVSNSLERRDFGWAMRLAYPLWLRLQARFIDRFVAMAESLRPELARAFSLAPHQIGMVHDGALSLAQIDAAEARPPAPRRQPGRTFMGVGRLAFQKDFGLLIRAFARAAQGDDRLVILGEGPERPRLERLAAELKVAGQVALPGHVADVGAHLAEADVFVLSSRYEGVPAAVLEALAAGAPIVATDCSAAMGELLAGGALGRLVAPSDVAALAEAMRAVGPATEAERRAKREQARDFTVERAAGGYLAQMQPLVRQRATDAAAARAGLAPAAVARPD